MFIAANKRADNRRELTKFAMKIYIISTAYIEAWIGGCSVHVWVFTSQDAVLKFIDETAELYQGLSISEIDTDTQEPQKILDIFD